MSETIRRAEPRDAGALTALMHASSAYHGEYSTILEGYQVTAGYVAAHLVFTTDAHLGFYALVEDELDLLFVADHSQGTGLGRRLIEHMLEQARGAGLTRVRVISHPPAEAFYLRMGAQRVGTSSPKPPRITWERPELTFGTGA
ncbi:GNAT family N-acetyltransferase [Nonomuraea endophytica]|uniref:GNAT superfamily N-acetyltransferase n=1 Tax=Nonomuraea endophytica TaxID=714136 RepID=A0A7W8EE25_9ACTN|nr:GNAT family N-acetyltransferase [Nonomuraea endophytica]MBB5075911.1 GNAT superfamily N-acetyltransferase [Nonomuraea endophytica]